MPDEFSITIPSFDVWVYDPKDPEGETVLLFGSFCELRNAERQVDSLNLCGMVALILDRHA